MKVALVGQPNSGKSTLFNAVAGYRSLTSNFAGTTVEYTHGQARVGGAVLELIDLPGLYSLTPTSAVEEVSRDYLLGGDWDVIINVLDASQLARSLELTLELLDLESPMVVCLNMMDEAARKGMTIDTHALEVALGVPVVEAIGARGRGIIETFRMAQEVAAAGNRPHAFVYAPDVERVVEELAEKIAEGIRGQSTGMLKAVRIPDSGVRSRGGGVRQSGARSQDIHPALDACRIFLHVRALFVGVLRAFPSHGRPARPARHGGGGGASCSATGRIGARGFPAVATPITNHQSPIANSGLSSRAFPGTSVSAERSTSHAGSRWSRRLRSPDFGLRTSDPGLRTFFSGVGAGGNHPAHRAACRRGGLCRSPCGLPHPL